MDPWLAASVPPSAGSQLEKGVDRRTFLASAAGGVAGLGLTGCQTTGGRGGVGVGEGGVRPVVVSTWPFGKPANERAWEVMAAGGSLLDAVVEGISITERDLSVTSVGAGGTPNADGVVSLDACIMEGATHRCGSVAGVEGILPVIGLARAVMERTRHVLLVGEGARQFALQQGFQDTELLSESERQRWEAWQARQASSGAAAPEGHDTIAMVILGADGHLAGGCSTSGLGYKLPGRVGDSPIIGSGLYVDDEVGAAGATGVGENIMRFCGSFQVVELMRAGATPDEACAETIRRIQKKHAAGAPLDINFLAVDKQGRFGAAGTGQGFEYAVTEATASRVLRSVAVPPRV